ncbi:hypothetical protein M0R45_003508 [Rubus argutus]|uniref:MADS-box domain-containing protein n=1 Tax=Rubus argutus TaxID=59490 RepID=A0AAW1YI73_RUBAR
MANSDTPQSSTQKNSKQKLLSRRKSYNNRSSTLKRKAKELSKQCKSQVCILSYNGSYDKDVQVWPEDPTVAKDIIKNYTEAVGKKRSRSSNQELNLADCLTRKKKMKLDGGKDSDNALDKLSGEALKDLSGFVESTLHELDYILEGYKSKPIVDQPYDIDNWNPLKLNGNPSNNAIFKGFDESQSSMPTAAIVPSQACDQYPDFQNGIGSCTEPIIDQSYDVNNWNPLELNENSSDNAIFKGFTEGQAFQYPDFQSGSETGSSIISTNNSTIDDRSNVNVYDQCGILQPNEYFGTTESSSLKGENYSVEKNLVNNAFTPSNFVNCSNNIDSAGASGSSTPCIDRSGISSNDSLVGFEDTAAPDNFYWEDILMPWEEQNNMNLLLDQNDQQFSYGGSSIIPY